MSMTSYLTDEFEEYILLIAYFISINNKSPIRMQILVELLWSYRSVIIIIIIIIIIITTTILI